MSRWGYILLMLMVVALASYTLWPQHSDDQRQPFWSEGIPPGFTLVLPDYEQQWYHQDGEPRVRIADLDRPGDQQACNTFWQPLLRLRAAIRQRDLSGNERQAYGLSEQQHLRLGDGRKIYWGQRDQQTWLYRLETDGSGVLVAAGANLANRLNTNGARLDQQQILPKALPGLNMLVLNGDTIFWHDQQWRWYQQAQRPAVSQRTRQLVSLLQQVAVTTLRGQQLGPAVGILRHRITLIGEQSWDIQLSLFERGPAIILNGSLPQLVTWDWWHRCEQLISELQQDKPYQLSVTFMDSIVEGLSFGEMAPPGFDSNAKIFMMKLINKAPGVWNGAIICLLPMLTAEGGCTKPSINSC